MNGTYTPGENHYSIKESMGQAAPDMLAALEAVERLLSGDIEDNATVSEMVRNAIKKAKGE